MRNEIAMVVGLGQSLSQTTELIWNVTLLTASIVFVPFPSALVMNGRIGRDNA